MKSVVIGFRLKEDVYEQLLRAAASASVGVGMLARKIVLGWAKK